MIQPVVEGHGEVEALPTLLRRLVSELGCYIPIATPRRRARPAIVEEQGFKTTLDLVRGDPQVTAMLFLFDADDDCARDHIPDMQAWLEQAQVGIPCAVVMARREYEAWFLGGLESLRGQRNIHKDASYPADPEQKRGAKETLSRYMPPNAPYDPRADQAALSAMFSLEQAYRRCSSFRKLVKELHRLLAHLGQQPVIPPHWNA